MVKGLRRECFRGVLWVCFFQNPLAYMQPSNCVWGCCCCCCWLQHGITDEKIHESAKKILLKMGEYFQIQVSPQSIVAGHQILEILKWRDHRYTNQKAHESGICVWKHTHWLLLADFILSDIVVWFKLKGGGGCNDCPPVGYLYTVFKVPVDYTVRTGSTSLWSLVRPMPTWEVYSFSTDVYNIPSEVQ